MQTLEAVLRKVAGVRGDNPSSVMQGLALQQNLQRVDQVLQELNTFIDGEATHVDYWGLAEGTTTLDVSTVNPNVLTTPPIVTGSSRAILDKAYTPLREYSACQLEFALPAELPMGRYTFSWHKLPTSVSFLEYDGSDTYYEHVYTDDTPLTFANPDAAFCVGVSFPLTTGRVELPLYEGGVLCMATLNHEYQVPPDKLILQATSAFRMGGFKLERGEHATPCRSDAEDVLARLSPSQIRALWIPSCGGGWVSRDALSLTNTYLQGVHFPREFAMSHTATHSGSLTLTTEVSHTFAFDQALIYGVAHLMDLAMEELGTTGGAYRKMKWDEYRVRYTSQSLLRRSTIARGIE